MNNRVDFYFHKEKRWNEEISLLRNIILETGLNEELKWGVPCYTYDDHNIALIHTFKEYCAILFMKGVLIDDPEGLLIQQTKNVQSARQMRFTDTKQIKAQSKKIRDFITKAIEIERSGKKVEFKKAEEFEMPEEFLELMQSMPELEKAFRILSPGRQKAYLLYFSSAKQSKTRESRIQKYLPKILEGKGMDD